MAVRAKFLIGSRTLTHGKSTYAVTKDGTVVGIPEAVEKELLELGAGFESCGEPEVPDIVQRLNKIVEDAAVLTPDQVRARMDEAVRIANPKTYEKAVAIARRAIVDLTGEECPKWLTAAERVGLGFEDEPGRDEDLADRIKKAEKDLDVEQDTGAQAPEAEAEVEQDAGVPAAPEAPARPSRLAAEPVAHKGRRGK